MIKAIFSPNSTLSRRFDINKAYLCDMAKANACQKRAVFKKMEDIGNRIYAVYQCPKHGRFRVDHDKKGKKMYWKERK